MIDESSSVENVIIIGGGPAGLAAAIYNSRANLNPLVFAGSPPGGQLTLTSEIENYPGFESILGSELIEKIRSQAKKFGTRIIDENVLKVDFSKKPFQVSTYDKSYRTKTILIATGAKALWLGLESETRLRGKGVSACATCDGFFFRGKNVAVVGGGDTAMEEALTLTKFANKVYIIHRRNEFRASKIMQDRVLNHPNIHEIYNAEVTEVLGNQRVEGTVLKIRPSDKRLLTKTKNELENVAPKMLKMKILDIKEDYLTGQIPIDGLFIAIGHKPDTDIFKGQIELDEKGYIITAERAAVENYKLQMTNDKSISNFKFQISNYRSVTSVEGVFAAGDCVDHVYRQAATAVGMGVAAALEIERYLENQD